MPGLNLGAGAQVRVGAPYNYGSVSAPTTASQAAFGPGIDAAASVSALSPTNPAGLATWTGIAGLALLIFIYYSLPG
jgi:hypothetical protein